MNGSTAPSHGAENGAMAGGVGRHSPAPVRPTSGGGGGTVIAPVIRPLRDDSQGRPPGPRARRGSPSGREWLAR